MSEATTAFKIGFLGAGQMAQALGRGLLSQGIATPATLRACDVSAEARAKFAAALGLANGAVLESAADLCAQSDVLILAVKPQQFAELLAPLRPVLAGKLLISIAAGVTLQQLEAAVPEDCAVIRTMPNTPALIGAGAAAFSRGSRATATHAAIAQRVLSAVGVCEELPEKLLDAVTALSGSGPAYVYTIIEALSDAGVACGLPRALSLKLAAQTVLGGARMVQETGQHPAQLRDAVTSPGGTTIAGLAALERGGLRAALMDAVRAAEARSRELASGK